MDLEFTGKEYWIMFAAFAIIVVGVFLDKKINKD